jgi:hypothetical protein
LTVKVPHERMHWTSVATTQAYSNLASDQGWRYPPCLSFGDERKHWLYAATLGLGFWVSGFRI